MIGRRDLAYDHIPAARVFLPVRIIRNGPVVTLGPRFHMPREISGSGRGQGAGDVVACLRGGSSSGAQSPTTSMEVISAP
jgi:hypothetical protein